MGQEEQNQHFLVFKVGSYRFCAPVDNVLGIIIPPHVTKMPLTPFHVAGMFLFWDKVALAIDMRRQLYQQEFNNNAGIFIVTQLDSGLVGFRVDKVADIIPSSKLEPCHIRFPEFYHSFKQFVLLDNEILLQTDFDMLFEADECAVSQPDTLEVIPSAQGDQTHDFEEEIAAVAERGDGVLVADQVRTDSRRPEPEQETPPEPEPEPKVEPKLKPEAAPISPSAPGLKESQIVGAKREEGRKIFADSSRNLNRQRPRPNKEFASAPQMPTKAPPRASLSHGKRRTDTLSSSGPLAREAKTRLAYSSSPARKSNGDEDSGPGWGCFVFPVILMAVLVFVGLFWWPKEERLPPQAPEVKKVAKEVARPSVKQDFYQKLEARETIVAEKVVETAVASHPQAQLDKPPPVSRLEGPTELVRVDTRDFTLTIERPSANEQKTESAILHVAAEEKTLVTDVMITHIVVKNDTLWDIASKYLGDPLAYAELARLSRINDPHWIYPGDIIRIVKKHVNDE